MDFFANVLREVDGQFALAPIGVRLSEGRFEALLDVAVSRDRRWDGIKPGSQSRDSTGSDWSYFMNSRVIGLIKVKSAKMTLCRNWKILPQTRIFGENAYNQVCLLF